MGLRRSILHLTLASVGLLALLLRAAPASCEGQQVESPYVVAARNADVPADLLIAIAGAESGYHPWALNIKGHQVFCQSREEAENVLANTPTDDVDIGLMQINWRFWGPRSGAASKSELLDPRRNLELGAAILKAPHLPLCAKSGHLPRRMANAPNRPQS